MTRLVVAFCSMAALAASVGAAQSIRVDAGQLFGMAEQAERDGREDEAEAMLRALTHDPNRDYANEARFRLAKFLERHDRKKEAAVLLRRIVDDNPSASPARFELAALLAGMGDEGMARAELRALRADTLPQEVAQMVDRFSTALRARKPFGGTLKMAFLADSNINRATQSDTLGTVIGDFTLSDDARARSGRGVSGEGQAYARVALGKHALLATVSGSADLYRNHDFNDVTLGTRIGPELSLGKLRLAMSAGVARRWFGGDVLTDIATAQADAVQALDPRTQGRLTFSASKIEYQPNSLQDGWSYGLSTQVDHAFGPSTGGGLLASVNRQELADRGYSAWSGQTGFYAWRQLGRFTVTGSAAAGRLVADKRLFLYPDKRDEWSRRFSFGVTARKFSLWGFAPTAQVTREANRSSIEIYDYRRTAFEAGITRAF